MVPVLNFILFGFNVCGSRWATELKNVDQLSPNVRIYLYLVFIARGIVIELSLWVCVRHGFSFHLLQTLCCKGN
jgi:hypothetical protein